MFYFTTVFIIYRAFSGISPEEVFIGSKNGLSLYLICGLLLILFLDRHQPKSLPIVPIIIVTIFSLWGTSRSGMVVSIILLIAIVIEILINLKYMKIIKKHRRLIIVSIVVLLAASSQLYKSINVYTHRLQVKGLMSNDRTIMNNAYLEHLTLKRIIFGSDLYSIPEIVSQNVNPHNFYIFIHSGLGIVSIIMFFLIILYLRKLFQKGSFAYGLVVFAFLLRMGADTGARSMPFFIFMMIVFESCIAFNNKKLKVNSLSPN